MFRNFDMSLLSDGGLQWTEQKTYATWYKEPFEIDLVRAEITT